MKKDFLIILSVIFLVVVLIMGTDFQSVENYYKIHIDDITSESQTVFVSIRCDTILNNWEKLDKAIQSEEYVPSDGVILPRTEYVLREGDSAFDMLRRVTRHNKIQMEYLGADTNKFGSAYIRGINYIYEFSCGELSGWMLKVNDEFLNFGSSKYKLKDKDEVEWLYTCDLGKDIGGSFEENP